MFITTTCGTRTRFKDDDEIKQASESYLESMQQELYLTGIKKFFDKCNLCIGVKGDYLNNNKQFCLCHLCIILSCKTFWTPLVCLCLYMMWTLLGLVRHCATGNYLIFDLFTRKKTTGLAYHKHRSFHVWSKLSQMFLRYRENKQRDAYEIYAIPHGHLSHRRLWRRLMKFISDRLPVSRLF